MADTDARAPRSLLRSILLTALCLAVVAGGVGVVAALTRPDVVQAVETQAPGVWVTDAAAQYGRVNTSIRELDTVQAITTTSFAPTKVLQSGGDVVLVSGPRYLAVDPARPADVGEDAPVADLPSGTQRVEASGAAVALLAADGGAFTTTVGALRAGELPTPVQLAGSTEDDQPWFLAVTTAADGTFHGYTTDGRLVTATDQTVPVAQQTDGPTEPSPEDVTATYTMTVFGDHWALLRAAADDAAATLWIDGVQVAGDLDGHAVLAGPSDATSLYVATSAALLEYTAEGTGREAVRPSSPGEPAAPVVDARGCAQAAWAGEAVTQISSCGKPAQSFADDVLSTTTNLLEFRSNGASLVLNDLKTGVVWSWDAGTWRVVPSSLSDWATEKTQDQAPTEEQNQVSTENVCPVPASGDAAVLGVRAGGLDRLPVLVGATDANPLDILTIVPGSVSWKGEGLGDVTVVDDGQALAVDVPEDAAGSGRLTYSLTDGQQAQGHDCIVEAIATVEVHDPDVNGAPALVGRSAQDAKPSVSLGSTVSVDALAGWLDPDGDSYRLTVGQVSAGTAIARPDGTVLYHPEAGQQPGDVQVPYTVTDAYGKSAEGSFTVAVDATPDLVARTTVLTAAVGVRTTVDLSDSITGAAAGLQISDLTVAETDAGSLAADVLPSGARIAVTPASEGRFSVRYTVTSGEASTTGTVQLTVVPRESATIASAPLRVYVRSGEDVTIDPLTAVENPGGAVLAVGEVTGLTSLGDGASIEAQTVGSQTFRVAADAGGAVAADGRAIGTFRYTVSGRDGSGRAVSVPGEATVYLLPDVPPSPPIAVDDQVVVRAGATVDVDVLANDVAAAGTAMVLDPRVRQDEDLASGLAFPSGGTLRYLAPTTPGTYQVAYRVFARGYPDQQSTGTVFVTVRGTEALNAPLAQQLQGSVAAFGTVDLAVPRFGVDPDGDEVFATAVTQPASGGQVQIIDNGSTLRVTSTSETGPVEFGYTVSDGTKEGRGTAQVAVVGSSPQPVAFNDYLFGATGTEVSVNPVLNDAVPAGQTATVTSVVRLSSERGSGDTPGVSSVPVEPPAPGESLALRVTDVVTTYQYTVVTRESGVNGSNRVVGSSTASIVVSPASTSVPPYPVVTDTVVGPRQILDATYRADVLTDKVAFAGGAVTASLVGAPQGTTLDGSFVQGPVTDDPQVVPFAVTAQGTEPGADPVVSYGFVRVPSALTLRPELVDPSHVYVVDEGSSIEIALPTAVATLPGKQLEVTAVRSEGLRREASCTAKAAGSTTVVYRAGTGTETRDGCSVTVQWRGEPESSVVIHLGVRITLANPAPVVSSGVQILSVAPLTTGTYDLAQLVQWDRHSSAQVHGLRFACDRTSSNMRVSCQGTTLTAVVEGPATQGAVEAVPVTVVGGDGYPYTPEVTATVRILVAPSPSVRITVPVIARTLAEGATLTVDVGQEIGPLLQKSYYGWSGGYVTQATSSDGGVRVSVSGAKITVTVAAGTPGGTKTIAYHFVDNPDHAHPSTGSGTIRVDYRALPSTPELAFSSADASSVSLTVRESRASLPAVSALVVTGTGRSGRKTQSCVPRDGSCTVRFGGMTPNEVYSFQAVARNEVGESARASAAVSAWAYLGLDKPTVTWVPLPGGDTAKVRLYLSGNANTSKFVVTGAGASQTVSADSQGRASTVVALPGFDSEDLQVQAVAALPPPSGGAAPTTERTVTVHGVGAARIGALDLTTDNLGNVTASTSFTPQGDGSVIRVGWALNDESCSPSSTVGGDLTATKTYAADAVRQYRRNTITVCAQVSFSGRGSGLDDSLDTSAVYGTSSKQKDVVPFLVPATLQGVYYWVVGTSDGGYQVRTTEKYRSFGRPDLYVTRADSSWPTKSNQHVTVRLCTDSGGGGTCSSKTYTLDRDRSAAGYAPDVAQYFTPALADALASCVYDDPSDDPDTGYENTTSKVQLPAPTVRDAHEPGSAAGSDAAWTLEMPDGQSFSSSSGSWPVTWSPQGTVDHGEARLTVRFSGDLAGLPDLVRSTSVTCTAADPPSSDPDPDPGTGSG